MRFNNHSDLSGAHAFLSPSSYHWINYDVEKLDRTYRKRLAAMRGSELHEFAKSAILLGQKLMDNGKTINQYVNDAIGYRMVPEQVLYFSENAFGTADTIKFSDGLLRIHDLKTGENVCSMNQLKVYVALFCLEYDVRPSDIHIELRIYKSNQVEVCVPELDEIVHIMDQIVVFDKHIQQIKMELI